MILACVVKKLEPFQNRKEKSKRASLPSVENYVIMGEKENDAYGRKSRKTI